MLDCNWETYELNYFQINCNFFILPVLPFMVPIIKFGTACSLLCHSNSLHPSFLLGCPYHYFLNYILFQDKHTWKDASEVRLPTNEGRTLQFNYRRESVLYFLWYYCVARRDHQSGQLNPYFTFQWFAWLMIIVAHNMLNTKHCNGGVLKGIQYPVPNATSFGRNNFVILVGF